MKHAKEKKSEVGREMRILRHTQNEMDGRLVRDDAMNSDDDKTELLGLLEEVTRLMMRDRQGQDR